MKNNRCKKGFTLIELLVVVLIIGILAAIALPQYQKAVEKAHAAEMITFIGNAKKAVASYLLENGGRPAQQIELLTTGVLNLDLTNGMECTASYCLGKKDYAYAITCSQEECRIVVYRISNRNVGEVHMMAGAVLNEDNKTWDMEAVYLDDLGKPGCQAFAQAFGATCEEYGD